MTAPPRPVGPTAEAAELSVRLAEYNQLKSEQQGRIQHRDGLVYTTLVAMAATVTGALNQHSAAVLLLLPPVAAVLGWKYLANDEKVTVAGGYLREQLSPRLAELTSAPSVLGWESAHRDGVYGPVRAYVQAGADVLTFCLLPLCALIAFWISGARPTGLLPVSIVEALLLAGVGWLAVLASWPRGLTSRSS